MHQHACGNFRVYVGTIHIETLNTAFERLEAYMFEDNGGPGNSDLSFLYDFVCDCPNPKIASALRQVVEHWLASKKDTPQLESLRRIQSQLNDKEFIEISWLLAVNPNTPPSVLQDLCSEAPTAMLERIAENSRTGRSTLADLSYQAIAEIRIATAANAHTPLASIMILIQDDNPDVRYSMAENPQLPTEALEILATDENPFVKFRAEKTLSRLADASKGA